MFAYVMTWRYHIFLRCLISYYKASSTTSPSFSAKFVYKYYLNVWNEKLRIQLSIQKYSLIAQSAPIYMIPFYVLFSSFALEVNDAKDLLARSECRLLARRRVSPPLGRKYWERSAREKARSLEKHASLNIAWK